MNWALTREVEERIVELEPQIIQDTRLLKKQMVRGLMKNNKSLLRSSLNQWKAMA